MIKYYHLQHAEKLHRYRMNSIVGTRTHVATASSVKTADAIFDPSVTLALIEREYPQALKVEFEQFNEKLRGDFRGFITQANARSQLAEFIAPFCSSPVSADIILREIVGTIHAFMDLTHQVALQIVFGQITSDHCRLFHSDKNHLRLLVSYAGKGTEWLKNENVNRYGLGLGKNSGYIAGRPIERLQAYDIAILKGDTFPGNEGHGLVHRSPPMLPGDSPRVFMALDAVAHAKPNGSGRNTPESARWNIMALAKHRPLQGKWRPAEAADGLFCRQVQARFRRLMREE